MEIYAIIIASTTGVKIMLKYYEGCLVSLRFVAIPLPLMLWRSWSLGILLWCLGPVRKFEGKDLRCTRYALDLLREICQVWNIHVQPLLYFEGDSQGVQPDTVCMYWGIDKLMQWGGILTTIAYNLLSKFKPPPHMLPFSIPLMFKYTTALIFCRLLWSTWIQLGGVCIKQKWQHTISFAQKEKRYINVLINMYKRYCFLLCLHFVLCSSIMTFIHVLCWKII